MASILAINGSYRDDGITDQTVNIMVQTLQSSGADIDVIQIIPLV